MELQEEDVVRRRPERTPVLSERGILEHLAELAGWCLEDAHLVKSFHFDNATDAGAFVGRVGETAEERNHHPHVNWWKRDVRIELWTHKSGGLTIRDFEFAQRCEPLSKADT